MMRGSETPTHCTLLYRNFDDSAEGLTEEDSADSDGKSLGEDAENSDE